MHGTLFPDPFPPDVIQYFLALAALSGVLGGMFCARARLHFWLPIYAVLSFVLGVWLTETTSRSEKHFNPSAFFESPLGLIFTVFEVGCAMIVVGVSWVISRWVTRGVIYVVLRRRGPARHRIP